MDFIFSFLGLSLSLIILFLSHFLSSSLTSSLLFSLISFHFCLILLLFTSPSNTHLSPSPLISQPVRYSSLLSSFFSYTFFYHNLPLMPFFHFYLNFISFLSLFYSISYPFPVQLFCTSLAFFFRFTFFFLILTFPFPPPTPFPLLSSLLPSSPLLPILYDLKAHLLRRGRALSLSP